MLILLLLSNKAHKIIYISITIIYQLLLLLVRHLLLLLPLPLLLLLLLPLLIWLLKGLLIWILIILQLVHIHLLLWLLIKSPVRWRRYISKPSIWEPLKDINMNLIEFRPITLIPLVALNILASILGNLWWSLSVIKQRSSHAITLFEIGNIIWTGIMIILNWKLKFLFFRNIFLIRL